MNLYGKIESGHAGDIANHKSETERRFEIREELRRIGEARGKVLQNTYPAASLHHA